MNTRKIISVLTWLFVLLSAFYLAGWFYLYQVRLPQMLSVLGPATERVEFQIASGESVGSVALRLERLGVIADDWTLTTYLEREGLDTQVESGYFRFPTGLTVPEVAEQLLSGEVAQIRFTILEGWSSAEIDTALTELELIEPNEFALFIREGGAIQPEWVVDRPVASLEGYIFPATYFLDSTNFSVEKLTIQMLAAMKYNLQQAGYDPDTAERSLHEILTIASIVELEERDPEQQKLVADLLWRRLDAGIALGADATLFYTLGHKEFLTAADLQTDSPYNTRKYRGLPPTPVSSPSQAAIIATLNPEANDYWFYLHDTETGEIYFARDLEGHNRNKVKYIR